jgi:tetratricopeptide (TPR) repeat protein
MGRLGSIVLAVSLLARAASAQSEAPEMSPEARAHYERGAAFSTAKNYEAAIREFQAAHAIEPRREFLFAWAQVERLSGDCESAIGLYQKFLDTTPPERQAEAARLNLSRCQQALGPRPEVPAAIPPAQPGPSIAVTAAPVPAPAPVATSTKVLLAAGAGIAGAGATLLVLSIFDERAAPDLIRYDDYLDRMHRARLERTLSFVGLGLGAGLVAVGLFRFAAGRHKDQPPAPQAHLGFWSGAGAGGFSVRGRF